MPRKDGSGPMGAGAITGRGFAVNQNSSIIIKELLIEQKKFLENRLEFINNKLESL
jgi:hypothetical protein